MTENVEYSSINPYKDKPSVISRLLQEKNQKVQIPSVGNNPKSEVTIDTRNPLGSGDLSIIFPGEMSDSREVAVKTLLPNEGVIGNPKDKQIAKDEFIKEGELLMKFDHPNVAHAYGVGEISISKSTTIPVIIREKFETTLGDIITGGGQEVSVLDVISQAAQALAYLEDNGVLVTDINPGNFGIRKDNTIALFDINLAKSSEEGKIGGKGIFTAPELSIIGQKDKEKAQSASQCSQVYSLGAMAYAAMGGQDARDDLAIGIDINNETISGIPEKISKVLIKSLSRNPNDRYENPVKMAEALHGAFDGKDD